MFICAMIALHVHHYAHTYMLQYCLHLPPWQTKTSKLLISHTLLRKVAGVAKVLFLRSISAPHLSTVPTQCIMHPHVLSAHVHN